MRFWLLLFMLGWRLKWLAKHNDGFKEKLEDKDMVLQFRTASGQVARYFIFRNNRVQHSSGIDSDADLCLSFKDAAYGLATFMGAAKDKTIFMQGVAAQDIKVTGNEQEMMWFMSVMTYLPPRKKKTTTSGQ